MNGMVWVRVLIGAVWVNGGLEKFVNPAFPAQFAQSLSAGGFVAQSPPFFQRFMLGSVVPNAELVAQSVRVAELLMGLALIVGLLTNLAALGSIVLSVMILLSQGGVSLGAGLGAPEFLNINLLMALVSLVVLLSAAAKSSSFDANLSRSRPALSALLTNRRSGSRSGYSSSSRTTGRRR